MNIGEADIQFLGHDGFLIITPGGKRIIIDPYNVSPVVEPADFILITHSHSDHCSIKDIGNISKSGTIILTTPDAQSKITHIEGVEMQIIESGDEITLGNIKIEAVPAYNIGKDFHPKSEGGIGYIIKMDKVIVYHAGDTDKIPEMQKLSGYGKHDNIFVALLPVSGTYVMNAEEAADAAGMLNPYIAIPMHYGAGVAGNVEDANNFVSLCESRNIAAKVLEKI